MILSSINLVVLLGVSWKLGRWTGIVDTRLAQLEARQRRSLPHGGGP